MEAEINKIKDAYDKKKEELQKEIVRTAMG